MDSMVVFVIGFAALIVFITSLWYLFQTLRVIWSYSSLLAIAAVLFSPLVHIAFYFFPKDGFDGHEKLLFKRYFLSLAAIAVLGVFAAVAIPAIEQQQNDEIVSNLDASQPWEWDIRAENQEEVLALAADEPSDSKAEELHYEAIYQAHPDADKIVESSDFKAWLQSKAAEDQDNVSRILNEGTSAEVIYIFSTFKKDLENDRVSEYQARRDNAQALAQADYQEKKKRDMEAIKAHNQRRQQAQNQQLQQQLSNQELTQTSMQQEPAKRKLTYSERQEREKLKALLSKPHKGSNGQLTRSQQEALVALETGQPMPSHSQNTGGAMPASRPTPSNMASCDGAGCWDTNGTRYNKGTGDTYFPSTGGVCQNVGGQMQCN